MNKEITIYNLGNLPTAPLDDFHELQEDFKISDPDKLSKLQMLILTRGFKYAFKAWKDPSGTLWIIDAHQRRKALLALRKAGFFIPAIPYEPIYAETKKEAVEEIAAYNSEFAQKNPDTLLFQKYQIETDTMERFNLPFEPVAFTWGEENKTLFADEPTRDEIQEDASEPILPEENKTVSRKEDVWLLGHHRLLCGDCLEARSAYILMNGRQADLCVSDPPYNVSYTGKTKDDLSIDNDEMDSDSFRLFLRQAFGNMYSVMREGGSIYIFHADTESFAFREAFKHAGFRLAQCCVWEKNMFTLGRQDYQWQHEPVLYGWKPGAAHTWYADRKQTTVWKFDKPQRSAIHPTMKPIALMAYPICNSSAPGTLVIDFFSGVGSTLMACQQTDRVCYAMEIDPRYVDATVHRYREMFRNQQVRLLRDGYTYSVEESVRMLG
jgi:DNA modification methylase